MIVLHSPLLLQLEQDTPSGPALFFSGGGASRCWGGDWPGGLGLAIVAEDLVGWFAIRFGNGPIQVVGFGKAHRHQGDNACSLRQIKHLFDLWFAESTDPAGAKPVRDGGEGEVVEGNGQVDVDTIVFSAHFLVGVLGIAARRDDEGGLCDPCLASAGLGQLASQLGLAHEDKAPRLEITGGRCETQGVEQVLVDVLRYVGLAIGANAAPGLDSIHNVHDSPVSS